MAADGRITINFDMDLPSIKSDADRANEVLHGIGSTAGDKMDEKMSENTEKVKQKAKKTSEEVSENVKNSGKSAGDSMSKNFNNNADKVKKKSKETKESIDNDFSKKTKIKLVADAKTAGIDNFKKILNKLPKEVQTELLTKADKGEAIDYEELLRRIPTKIASTAHLNDDASPKLEHIQSEAGRTEEKFSSLKTAIGGGIIGGAVVTGIQSAASGIAGLGSEAIEASDSIYKFKSTMKLGGFGEKGISSASKEVQKYANETVYELGDVSNTTAQLAANGVKGYMKLTEAAGNLNAQAGGNADTFKSVAMMLTQTAGAGKLTTENWNQLADAIPGASGVLQKAMKKNGAYTGNFRDAMADGKISSDEFNKALMQLGMNSGAKKAAKSTETFEGAFGNLKANVVTGMQEMLQKVGKKNLTNAINGASKAVVSLTKFFIKFINAIQKHKGIVVAIGGALATAFAVKKITDFIIYLGRAKRALLEFQAVSALTGSGGGVGGLLSKGAKTATVAEGATSLAGTAGIGSGLVATGTSLVSKFAKASPYLAAGAGVASELTSKNSTGAKAGGSVGSVGGAVAGAALGSAILPGIGTILGASAGSWVGKKFGEGFGKSLQDSVKGKTIKANVKISASAKASQIDADKLSKQLEPAIKKLDKKLVVKTSYDSKSMANTKAATDKLYSGMSKSIDTYYKNKESKSKKNLDNLVKQGVMTQKQADASLKKQTTMDQKERTAKQNALKQMQKDQTDYYAKVQNIQNGGTKKLQQIAQKYGVNSKKYEEEKNKELQKAHKNFVNTYIKDENGLNTKVRKDVSKGAKEQKSIYSQLIKDKGKLNAEDLKSTQKHADNLYKTSVKSARKTRDDVKGAADDQYHKTVATAKKEWKEKGTITYAQYKEIKHNADKQRDDTKGAADDQYRGVTKKARDQHDKVTSEITKQKKDVTKQANEQAANHAGAAQGEMTEVNGQYSSGFDGMRTIWNGIASGLNSVLNALHKGWGKIPKIGKHARGASGLSSNEIALVGEEGFELAHNPNRGMFALGTNGPEIRHLEAGTSILPHALSKQFLSMTHGLPAYKHGKSGTITQAYDWLKDKLDDTMSFVSEGAEKAFDFVSDKLGLKGFLSNYNAAQHDLMQGASDSTRKGFINYLKGKFHKYSEDNDGGGGKGTPSGSGVQRWAGQVKQALKANGLSTSKSMVNKVLRQINSESSGNEKAVQGNIGDINNITGDLAKGLMQTISATFNAYKFSGHGNIFNGYDNLLAALHYAKVRYGSSLSGLGNGHGYANGGWSFMPAIFGEVPGEPELAINPARDSADEHILQAIQARATKAPNSTTAQLAQVIENAKDSGQVTPIWGQRASQNIKVAAGDNSHDYTGHLDNVLDELDTIANKSLEINGHSFSKKYEAYGSARRVQRTQQARRGLAINVNI